MNEVHSINRFVRFQARGKKFEEVFACEAYAFVDYTVALRYGIGRKMPIYIFPDEIIAANPKLSISHM